VCAKFSYAAKWDRFMEMVEPIASTLPYMTSMGNHERDWDGTEKGKAGRGRG